MNNCDLNDLKSVIVTNLAESLENFDKWIHNISSSTMTDLTGKFEIRNAYGYAHDGYIDREWKLYYDKVFITDNNEIQKLSDRRVATSINNHIKNLVSIILNNSAYASEDVVHDYKCTVLRNSLFNENNISKFSELRWKYDTYHAEKELEKEALRQQRREQFKPKKSWWKKILNYRIV